MATKGGNVIVTGYISLVEKQIFINFCKFTLSNTGLVKTNQM